MCLCMPWTQSSSFHHLSIHSTPSNPQIRCIAADILWQPSILPCVGIFLHHLYFPPSEATEGTGMHVEAVEECCPYCNL